MTNKLTVFASAILLLPTAIWAQSNDVADSLRKEKRAELAPVTISGVRLSSQSPFAFKDMNAEEIEKNNTGQDIPYLLNYTPSVVVTSDAGTGIGYTGIRIRGTDGQRINFTVNGIPLNDAESQTAFFVNFPDLLSSASNVQIQRGVGSSTNGSGAFGASVNIENMKATDKSYLELTNKFGSFNSWQHTLKAGTGLLNNGFQFDLRASKISSDGYIERATSDLKALQLLTGWTSKSGNTNVQMNIFTGAEKTGQAWDGIPEDSLETNRRYNPVGMKEDGTFYNDQTDNYQQDYYQLFINQKIHEHWSAKIGFFLTRGKGYYNEYRVQDKFSEYGLPPFALNGSDSFKRVNLIRQRWLDNYFYGTVFSVDYHKEKTQVTFGGAISRYDGKHYGDVKWAQFGIPADYRWYENKAQKNDVNFYAKAQQEIKNNFYLFADLQYRHVYHNMDGFRKSPNEHPIAQYDFLNPKVGLSYITYHTGSQVSKIYASFAMAHKEPSRKDFEESPISFVQPERLLDYEFGYDYKSPTWTAQANLYYMNYKNQLVYSGKINDYGVYSRINVDKSYRAGMELSAAWQMIPEIKFGGNLTLSQNKILNFSEFIDDYDDGTQVENKYSKTDISFSPSVVGAAILSFQPFKQKWTDQDLQIDILEKYVGRQYLDNTENKNRSLNPYALTTVRFYYQTQKAFLKNMAWSLEFNNIFNKKYESNGYTYSYIAGDELTTQNIYFPQAGFNFRLGLTLLF